MMLCFTGSLLLYEMERVTAEPYREDLITEKADSSTSTSTTGLPHNLALLLPRPLPLALAGEHGIQV